MKVYLLFTNEDLGHDFTEPDIYTLARKISEKKLVYGKDYTCSVIGGAGTERTADNTVLQQNFGRFKFVYPISPNHNYLLTAFGTAVSQTPAEELPKRTFKAITSKTREQVKGRLYWVDQIMPQGRQFYIQVENTNTHVAVDGNSIILVDGPAENTNPLRQQTPQP